MDDDHRNAVRHARLSLAGDSQNVDAYANLARTYYAMKAYDVALLVCLNAEKIDPNKADIYNIMGMIWLAKNDVTEAIRQFRRALEKDSKSVAALMNLGAVILNVRDYEGAISLFEQVLALEPKNTEAKISIAVAKRGLGDLEAARALYEEVRAVEPENASVQFNLGVMEHEHMAQNAMIGLGQGDAPADPIAQMDWTIGNMEKALQHYEKAIEHYRNFLAYDREVDQEAQKEANERITQVQQLIQVTGEQIPQLKEQKIMIQQDMKAAEEAEAQAAAEEKAAAEAAAAQESAEETGTAPPTPTE